MSEIENGSGEALDRKLSSSGGAGEALFPDFPGRGIALDEVHARPTPQIGSKRIVLHYAFMMEGGNSVNQAIISEFATKHGLAKPPGSARYVKLDTDAGCLRWERHSEFSTWMWETDAPAEFGAPAPHDPFVSEFGTPGPVISALRMEIWDYSEAGLKLLERFRASSLCVSRVQGRDTLIATDFRQNERGETVFLILADNMRPVSIGNLAKKLIDVETYRTLALLGLPLAQSLSSDMSRIEIALSRLTADMRGANAESGRQLLEEISELSAELEAGAAASLFRFGASNAYGDIVAERLASLECERVSGYHNLETFLERRLGPALRTCRSVENRQANLSRKLTRAANLLRTRIEVEIEEQNRNLLSSMDKRAQLQLRLQQTVEGLSVAAVSYYMVGLFYYLAQAFTPMLGKITGMEVSAKVLAGLFAPIAILLVWLMVRRIRKHHSEEGH